VSDDVGGLVMPEAVRAARRRWAGGVAVVITRDGDGFRGATVGAFAVVSLVPPLVLVCLDREGRMSKLVPATGAFTVSILDRRHEFFAERFAGRAPLADARLTGIPHELALGGLPVLIGALAWFDCRVQAVHDGGDHVIVVGTVSAVGVGEDSDDPLVYYEGRYRSLEPG
jgi:flavin reductase (DIM6/NTAB) family NADH-FMN oxidoreductase RutF